VTKTSCCGDQHFNAVVTKISMLWVTKISCLVDNPEAHDDTSTLLPCGKRLCCAGMHQHPHRSTADSCLADCLEPGYNRTAIWAQGRGQLVTFAQILGTGRTQGVPASVEPDVGLLI
jgi:hypothetical protein